QTLLGAEQIDETVEADSARLHILPECLEGVHAIYGSEAAAFQLRQFSGFFQNSAGWSLAGRHANPRPAGPSKRATRRYTIDIYLLFPIQLAVGDLNGDGKPDIVVNNPGRSSVSVLL